MKASVIRGIAATVLLFAALSANAQIRTGGDIDSGTFIMGLDNYFCGAAGGLNFNIGSDTISVSLNGGLITVTSNGSGDEPVEQTVYNNGLVVPFVTGINLPQIYGDFVVGIHDFTGDNVPELVLGVRNASAIGLEVYILKLKEEGWGSIGEVAVFGIAGVECRIFRHTITVIVHVALADYPSLPEAYIGFRLLKSCSTSADVSSSALANTDSSW